MATKRTRRKNPDIVRVGAAQMISRDADLEANVDKALRFCDRAARRGVQILCFPECAATGYEWQRSKRLTAKVKAAAEPLPGPMVRTFEEKARQTNLYVIMGTVERPRNSNKLYNAVFVVGPTEGYMGKYRKAMTGGVFTPGRAAPVFDTAHGRLGIFICHDSRYSELARLMALKGAQMLFQPTNYFYTSPPHLTGHAVRRLYSGKQASSRMRAMDNGLQLVVANAGRREYVNDSRIETGAKGGPQILLARATRKEQLIAADLELQPKFDNKAVRSARKWGWLFREFADAARAAAGGK